MTDQVFIEDRIKRGYQALDKVNHELSKLNRNQLNWKPNTETWSIAECLNHLIIADGLYFEDFSAIGRNEYEMSLWELHSPFTHLFGKTLINQMKEKVTIPLKTHKILKPPLTNYETKIVENYTSSLRHLINLVSVCNHIDLGKVIISSPTIKWITYSFRDALEFLFEHEHRHINQAIRLKSEEGFPT